MRRIPPALLWLTLSALIASALYLTVFFHFRLVAPNLLDSAGQDLAIRYLRATIDGRKPSAAPSELGVNAPGRLWVTLYLRGEPIFRHSSQEADVASALDAAARALEGAPSVQALSEAERRDVRIKVDLELGSGPINSRIGPLFAMAVVPGLDGLALRAGERTAYLLPDDLFRRDLLAGYEPFFFMREFRAGLDLRQVIDALADQLDLSAEAWRAAEKRYFRFRVQSFVENLTRDGAIRIFRLRQPVPRVNRRMVREAVVKAADYVLRLQRHDGSFGYIYYPMTDSYSPPGDYSLPRHAGTTWFLSLAYSTLREPRFKEGAERAIAYLAANSVPKGCQSTPYACIGSDDQGDLGSAALGIVAIAEYQESTGDRRYEPLARRLGRFITWMQKPNGDFCHQYRPATAAKNCHDILLYYSGEAALALAKLWRITGDASYVKPLERALDFLVGENYDFFLGQFFISEDHWTCIAAEAAFEAVNKDSYARFCYAFAELNRRAQLGPDEGLASDLAGSFNITPFFMPHNTPVGSRTEANVATYLLSMKRREPQQLVLDTVRDAIRYLVDQQIRPEWSYLFPDPEAAEGGMMQTPIRAAIRIDYVQHAAAALARGLELVPE